MKTAHEIINTVGAANAAKALGVKVNAIHMQVRAGSLPASWFNTLERLACRPLDRKLFNFKGDR